MTAQPEETVLLIEAETNGVPRMSWCFPSIGDANIGVLAARAQLTGGNLLSGPIFTWFRWKSTWYYALARDRRSEDDVVDISVPRFAVVIGSSLFDPERYCAMLEVMMRAFNEEGSPIALLQRVLTIATKGSASAAGGPDFVCSKFHPDTAKLACAFSRMIKLLGAEGTAAVWAAVLLRMRVVVHAPDVAALLDAIRCIPLLVTHRSVWERLRPLCALETAQLDELSSVAGYISGFTDSKVAGRPELYDVFVDAQSGELKLGEKAAVLQLPSSLVGEVKDALQKGAASTDGGAKPLVDALASKTAEMVKLAANAPTANAEWAEFLAQLQQAEAVGASA